jgi:hypothetical protein
VSRQVEIMPGPIETDMLATSDRPAAAIEHALNASKFAAIVARAC